MNQETQQFHFFGCNSWEWKVSNDLFEIVSWFSNQKYGSKRIPYSIWYVPLPKNLEFPYAIDMYAPQVDGAKYLGTYLNKKLAVV